MREQTGLNVYVIADQMHWFCQRWLQEFKQVLLQRSLVQIYFEFSNHHGSMINLTNTNTV